VVNVFSVTSTFPGLEHLAFEPGRKSLAASMLGAEITVTLEEVAKMDALEIARTYLSGQEVRRLLKELTVLRTPVYSPQIKKVKRPTNRAVFFHAGTFVAHKHLKEMTEMVGRAVSLGYPARMMLTSQHTSAPDWTKVPYVDLHLGVDRKTLIEAYYPAADFGIVANEITGTGIAYFEQVFSGMVPLWLIRPWNLDLFPPDYPFAAKSLGELEKMVIYCSKHPQEAKSKARQGVEWVNNMFSPSRHGLRWLQVLQRAASLKHAYTRERCKGHFLYHILREALVGVKGPIKEKELLERFFKKSKNIKNEKDLSHYRPYFRAIAEAACLDSHASVVWKN
jgi:hypothetical protein